MSDIPAALLRACNADLWKAQDRSARAYASAPDRYAELRESVQESVKRNRAVLAAAAAAEGAAAAADAAAAAPQPALGTERGVDVPVLVASTLYTMGFESERVDWALEQSGQCAAAALTMLLAQAQRGAPDERQEVIDLCSDEEVIDLCSDDDEPRAHISNEVLKALRDEREARERKMDSRGQKRSRD
jgi:hypothetical protein